MTREARRTTLQEIVPEVVPRILILAVPRGLASPRRTNRPRLCRIVAVYSLIVLACPMFAGIVALCSAITGGTYGWNVMSWFVLAYAPLNTALLLVPLFVWRRLTEIAGSMDAMMKDRVDRNRVAGRVQMWCVPWLQVVLGGCFGVLGWVGADSLSDDRSVRGLAALPFEASGALTLLLAANVVYWIVGGMNWLWLLSRQESVRFDTVDPMLTKGLSNTYGIVQLVRWCCLVGDILALAPLTGLYVGDERVRLKQAGLADLQGGLLHYLLQGGAAASVIVVIVAYCITPWRMAVMRRRDQKKLLREIRGEIDGELSTLSDGYLEVATKRLDLYSRVSERRVGNVDRELITALLLTVATAAGPLLPLIFHHKGS